MPPRGAPVPPNQIGSATGSADGHAKIPPVRIIPIPGHTPGNVAILAPAVDALFVGDALTTGHVLTGAIGPGPAPFTMNPGLALESLSKLEEVPATWVLPGHGAPWNHGTAEPPRRSAWSAPPHRARQPGTDSPALVSSACSSR